MSTVGTQQHESKGNAVDVDPEDDVEEETEQQELETDDLFHILQNQRRRRVLKFLQDYDEGEQVDMRDVAEQVAAWEHETTVQQLSSNERQRVYIALYQSHLPKLDEKGVLEYNQSRGIVERTPVADQFDPYLDVDGADDEETPATADEPVTTEATAEPTTAGRSSTSYYSGATALGLALTAMSWVGVAPTAVTSYLATFITGMFAFITIGLNYQRYA
ncbi:hypothetical protein SAMN04487948_101259 [Halogranum amylolyticum]|uniref:DUF7344 domain-containing protein n=1 Tax=Halogranum amylolyticum TaxID=660520 RepID=A0A1H8N289_9EURY|nr:hypothetical protein [Halogranum amylolyticum]SEO23684.1 hypothetical protein SAMN04487948_101259 [Halogranum amylolyticum]